METKEQEARRIENAAIDALANVEDEEMLRRLVRRFAPSDMVSRPSIEELTARDIIGQGV